MVFRKAMSIGHAVFREIGIGMSIQHNSDGSALEWAKGDFVALEALSGQPSLTSKRRVVRLPAFRGFPRKKAAWNGKICEPVCASFEAHGLRVGLIVLARGCFVSVADCAVVVRGLLLVTRRPGRLGRAGIL